MGQRIIGVNVTILKQVNEKQLLEILAVGDGFIQYILFDLKLNSAGIQ